MRSRPSNVRGQLAAVLTAIFGGTLVFVAMPLALLELASVWAKCQSAKDPSFGDSIGWGLIIVSPILLAVDLGLSVGIAVFIYAKVKTRWVANDNAKL
jgi:hypothetical protein